MSRTEYRFDGLDALEQQLSRMIEEEYPAEFRALVIQIAYELQGKVKEKTCGDKKETPEGVSFLYCAGSDHLAALAALMDSISSGTTLNRSPTIP